MVTSKNPYLYTPNSIEDVLNNCKLDEYGTKLGLNSSEKKKYIERNIMFKSYDEICFGDSSEHRKLTSFLSSIIILDILFESYDDNLWRIVLGYMPLNIEFEKIRLDVVDVQKVYGILFEEHYELFMTGIFRATEKVLNVSTLFWEFYEEREKNINKIAFIDVYLNEFYNEILKKKIDKFINDGSYYGYKEKYIHENNTYQNLESIISIQQEMRLYQGGMESVEIRKKYGNKVWNDNLLNGLSKDNIDNVLGKYTDEYLDYEDIDTIYATYILELTEKLLHLMSSFQSFREENSHWQGNYLGYVKKYQYGNEILKQINHAKSLPESQLPQHTLPSFYHNNKNFKNAIDNIVKQYSQKTDIPECLLLKNRWIDELTSLVYYDLPITSLSIGLQGYRYDWVVCEILPLLMTYKKQIQIRFES